ncbi:MAG: hypothetical protein HY791_24520 [Deltaproteobacteria bacterium]|nr:hypothetical protein [Deltaproteobacteria bacterium]
MRGRFRITDPACLEVLRALSDVFGEDDIGFAVAGGMGVQALIAAAGLDHLLRATGDIDLVVSADDVRIVRALNQLAADRPELTVVQNPAAKNARVGALNVDWINEPSRARGIEQAWAHSVENARVVRVRKLDIPVQEPEVLLAAKLTGQKVRPQDQLDLAAVVSCRVPVDLNRLRELVAARPGRFELFEEIRMRVAEE